MRLPNLLATSRGRLFAFFALYLTEGLPLGFAATAVATQLRRQDVGAAEIGAFVGSFYLPWAFKWAFGPLIDVFRSQRFGHRRGWILLTQTLMMLTLLSTVLLKMPEQLGLFTLILLVHNTFGAMQDVAIDALACSTLREEERGVANGMMFAGASIGMMLGGGGVLFLSGYTGFQATFFFVASCIMLVTLFVVLPMQEAAGEPQVVTTGSRWRTAAAQMSAFATQSFRSFLGTRGAFTGLFFALLPSGAMALGLALQSNLAVELGMNDDQVGWLSIWSSLITAIFCVLGGMWSDQFGRRKMLFVYMALMSVPTVYLAWVLSQYGWIMPVPQNGGARPEVPAALLTAFWVAVLSYSLFQGLMYGTRSAIFMDVTNPKVAATQFTAYMALLNLGIAYTATWQGIAIEAWGYPRTLVIDAIAGLLCLILLPLMARKTGEEELQSDVAAPTRARAVAGVLALLCLAWVPYRMNPGALGAMAPVAGTFFTVIFVGSALFLLAANAVLGGAAAKLKPWTTTLALLLLAMHLRHFADGIDAWLGATLGQGQFKAAAELVFLAVPAAAAALLAYLAWQPWGELASDTAPITA